MKILLGADIGIDWERYGNLSVKGTIEEEFEEELHRVINEEVNSESNLMSLFKKNNRFFSLVLEKDEYIYAAVDHLRMYPLYYSIKNGQAYLSDDAKWIRQIVQDKKMDELAATEFLMTGYVTGGDTLFPNVKQLQAGEYLIYNRIDKSVEVKRYNVSRIIENCSFDKEAAFNELDQIHMNVFERLIESLNGRTAVIPLSGGYDSRVIAMMLKRLGYENVICFTYGRPGNKEAKVSKEIAEFLNYDWLFVSYTPEKWTKWFESKEKEEFFNISNGLTSLAHIQDHMAIGELKDKGLIPEESVIIPGHTAMLSFSGYNQDIGNNNQVTSAIMKKHYSLWSQPYKKNTRIREELEKRVLQAIGSFRDQGETIENSIYFWELSERHAKFICNSVRAYEQFGYEWRLPLWEKEMVDFWLNIPQKFRLDKILYKEYFDRQFVSKKKEISTPNIGNENIGFNYLKEKVKEKKLLLNVALKIKKISAYYRHPLDWYKIISFSEYLNGLLKGAVNINSFLSKRYIDYIKRKKQD